MTSEGLWEMFEGDSADTCGGNLPLVSMGAERRVKRAQTRERGPPSAPAEILSNLVIIAAYLSTGGLRGYSLGKIRWHLKNPPSYRVSGGPIIKT